MKNGLTIIVLTNNDEDRIVDCLEAVNFSNEIIIIDDNSSDRTVEIAKRYTSNIFVRPLNNDFSSQRNFALNHAHNSWVLFVDSDEIVSERLKNEILNKISNTHENGFYLKRIDVMWGRKIVHGEVGGVRLMRLAKIDYGKWHGKVHEIWEVKESTGVLVSPLLHFPHRNVMEFVRDIDQYSSLRAIELFEKQTKVSFLQIILFPIIKFFLNFIVKRGYKDGVPGFIYAMSMSFHSFLVRGKLFQLNHY